MNTITHTKIAPLMVPAVTMDTSSFVVVKIASTIIKLIQICNIQCMCSFRLEDLID